MKNYHLKEELADFGQQLLRVDLHRLLVPDHPTAGMGRMYIAAEMAALLANNAESGQAKLDGAALTISAFHRGLWSLTKACIAYGFVTLNDHEIDGRWALQLRPEMLDRAVLMASAENQSDIQLWLSIVAFLRRNESYRKLAALLAVAVLGPTWFEVRTFLNLYVAKMQVEAGASAPPDPKPPPDS
ncbi:MAG: hypothetical protein V1821_02150 [bacterium]